MQVRLYGTFSRGWPCKSAYLHRVVSASGQLLFGGYLVGYEHAEMASCLGSCPGFYERLGPGQGARSARVAAP